MPLPCSPLNDRRNRNFCSQAGRRHSVPSARESSMTTLQRPHVRAPRLNSGAAIAAPVSASAGARAASAARAFAASSATARVLPAALLWSAAHRGRLLAAYGLLTTEHLLRLAQPLVIGLAIN